MADRKALKAEAALADFMADADLYDSDQRTLRAALNILRKEAARG